MVRCLGDSMEVFLGGQQMLSTRTIRRLAGQVIYELGDLVGLSDGRLLGYAKIKVTSSFLPICPR